MAEAGTTGVVGLPASPVFATTRWSVVLRAGNEGATQHEDALAQLCRTYWYPLYAYVRRQGATPEDAQDLTQSFFMRLLERNYLDRADAAKGKFRWFLLGALKHHLAREREWRGAAKRGGGAQLLPLDEIEAEQRYHLESAKVSSPDRLFDRSWALTLLDRARAQLREHYAQAGKQERFDRLEGFIPGSGERPSYEAVARELDVSEGALRVELHRMKAAYREFLRTEIAHTVSSPVEIDEELRYLIEIMQG